MADFMKDMDAMKPVSEAFDIDEEELSYKAESSDYWKSSYDFYKQVKDRVATSLTERQRDWLNKIEDKLSEDDDGYRESGFDPNWD